MNRRIPIVASFLTLTFAATLLAQQIVTPTQRADIAAAKIDPFMLRHQAFIDRAKQGNVDLLFLGDSITEGWRTQGQAVWEKNYSQLNAANFGIGGDQTQHVLWRIENGELENIKPKVVVLMIGTNNTSVHPVPEIVHGIELIVKTIRTKLPTSKILLLAVFPRDAATSSPNIETRKAQIKEINAQIMKWDDGKIIRYLDIGPKFLNAEGKLTPEIMPDYLHPNARGYEIWAESMKPLLDEMMKS